MCSDFADLALQLFRTLPALLPTYAAGVQSPRLTGQHLHCLAISEKRSRIVPERERNPGPSSKCTDQAQNALPQDSVAAEAQFRLRRGLSSSKHQLAHNSEKSRCKRMPAAHGQAQNLDRARLPVCKAARRSCNPPTGCRDFARFDSPANKIHTLPCSRSVSLRRVLFPAVRVWLGVGPRSLSQFRFGLRTHPRDRDRSAPPIDACLSG